ncbi:tetratricopeptide repeat protein [Pyxidicoccus sp. 3LG]
MTELPLPKERHLRPYESSPLAKVAGWGVLVFLFVFFYNLFSRGGTSLRESLPPGFAPVAAGGVFLGLFGFFFFRMRRWMTVYHRGVSFYGAGNEREAAVCFEEAARRGTNGVQRSVSVAMLGQCLLALGEPGRALELFGSAERARNLKRSLPAAHRWIPNLVATCGAALGDMAAARAWLEEGRKRLGDTPPMYALLPEVMVLCREGHYGVAVKTVDTRWAEADASGGRDVRRLKLLKAFALEAQDASAHAEAIHDALVATQPVRPGDFEVLTAQWPELRAFMERRGLSASRAA